MQTQMHGKISQLPTRAENESIDEIIRNNPVLITLADNSFDYTDYVNCVAESKTEKNILLGTLADPLLKIQEPILINFYEDLGKVIAEAPEFEVEGIGDDLTGAMLELQMTIQELYYSLSEDRENLGPHMVKILSVLEKKITR